jgi:hypothetical protein
VEFEVLLTDVVLLAVGVAFLDVLILLDPVEFLEIFNERLDAFADVLAVVEALTMLFTDSFLTSFSTFLASFLSRDLSSV